MTPTDFEFDLDVTVVDEDYDDCSGFGSLPCTRAPAKTVVIEAVQLNELVVACRGD